MQTGKSISISKALATAPLPSTKRTSEEAVRMEKWANKVMAEHDKNHFSPVKVSEAGFYAAQKDLGVLAQKIRKSQIFTHLSFFLGMSTGALGIPAASIGLQLVEAAQQGYINLSVAGAELIFPAGIALCVAASYFVGDLAVREFYLPKKFALTLQNIASKHLRQNIETEKALKLVSQVANSPQEEFFVVGCNEPSPTITVHHKNHREYLVQSEAKKKELRVSTLPRELTSSNSVSDPYLAGVNEKLATILSLTLTVEEQALVERVKEEALETSQLYQEVLKIQSNKSSKTAEALMESNLSLLERELDTLLEEKAKGVEDRMRVQANYLQSRHAPESKLSLDSRRQITSQAGA